MSETAQFAILFTSLFTIPGALYFLGQRIVFGPAGSQN